MGNERERELGLGSSGKPPNPICSQGDIDDRGDIAMYKHCL